MFSIMFRCSFDVRLLSLSLLKEQNHNGYSKRTKQDGPQIIKTLCGDDVECVGGINLTALNDV